MHTKHGRVADDPMDVGPMPDHVVGLTHAEARARLERDGPNRLAEAPARPVVLQFLDQFRNLLVAILLGAAALAFVATGEVKDPVVIGVVVLLNATLGFLQERRAEASMAALGGMLAPSATVRRDGRVVDVPAEGVVVGDVVLVEAGDRIPADGRWLVSVDHEVDESTLTGESVPTRKDAHAELAADAPLSERADAAFMQTTVTRGRGEMLVTATGMDTEIGHVAELLRVADPGPSPLQREIHALARTLTIVAATAVVLVLVVGIVQGGTLANELLDAVALAVAAIPEGLPAVLTVTLAVGAHQLARHRAIVKRLSSVETLGCATVICSDKTGTLTLNRMSVKALWIGGARASVSGDGYGSDGAITEAPGLQPAALRALLEPFALCNDSRVDDGVLVGDPTEGALVVVARKGGVEVDDVTRRKPRVDELPFDSATKVMATLHRDGDRRFLAVKGAADVVIERCVRIRSGDGSTRRMADDDRRAVRAALGELAAEGLRVLAAASRRLEPAEVQGHELVDLVDELTFEGLAALQDPPRPEARGAIAECTRAGLAVKMITGDHAATAGAIASQLGIPGSTVTGAQLDELTDEQLAARIDDIGVVARVSPAHKVRIVKALRARDHVVAMTGDGVNDAAALKMADIGIAMGVTGTEVTKEAATMVLADDDFSTIVRAVRGGRTVYDNIVKFVRFQLATNIGAILTILGASLIGLPYGGGAFFVPLALLWVNLIMDGPPALALGVDPPGPDTMTRPPRARAERILGPGRLWSLLVSGSVMAAGTLGVYLAVAGSGAVSETTAARATALAFTTFVFFQVANAVNARFERRSSFGRHSLTNWKLGASLLTIVVLQVVAMSVAGVQRAFTGADVAVSLTLGDWLVAGLVAVSIVAVEETRKWISGATNRGGFR